MNDPHSRRSGGGHVLPCLALLLAMSTGADASGRAETPSAPLADVPARVDQAHRDAHPPRYPEAAARAGIEGEALLLVSVDRDGTVLDVRIERSSRHRGLDQAAVEAAGNWRYLPARQAGQPVAGRTRLAVSFQRTDAEQMPADAAQALPRPVDMASCGQDPCRGAFVDIAWMHRHPPRYPVEALRLR